jgi:multisubunit Na+/H+ antiporter MnhF subunit
MSTWLLASIVLVCGLIPCLIACLIGDALQGLPALSLAGVVTVVVLITLTEAFHRQSFIDLAVVLASGSFVGGLAFIRFMARRG